MKQTQTTTAPERVDRLFMRCLSVCCLHVEFWSRYVEWLCANGRDGMDIIELGDTTARCAGTSCGSHSESNMGGENNNSDGAVNASSGSNSSGTDEDSATKHEPAQRIRPITARQLLWRARTFLLRMSRSFGSKPLNWKKP